MARPASGNLHHNQHGVVLLLSVLIATAVGVAIGISVIMAGLILSQGSLANREANLAKAMANACAEAGLQQIRNSTAYTGTGNLTISGNACSYIVTSGAGEARTIAANSTVGSSTRRVTVQLTAINPSLVVSSWLEQ